MAGESAQQKPPQRVTAYIDGFNLYYGLRDTGFRRFFWLDVCDLARRLLLPHQVLVAAKYFTARISGGKPSDRKSYRQDRDAKRKRQADYLSALATVDDLKIIEGHFLEIDCECKKCGATWSDAEEKMTDVNIATEMIVDSFANQFDTALLISGDSDLVPPVRAILKRFPHKRVTVAFPPGRSSYELKQAATGQFVIGRKHLKNAQLPDSITLANGHNIERPESWKAQAD